jgi:nucleoside-diphosphate-sugar epimerase
MSSLTKVFAQNDVDVVFHLAGLVSFARHHKAALMDVNVDGTRNMFVAARDAGVNKFIHVRMI